MRKLLATFLLAGSSLYGSAILVSSPTLLPNADTMLWSQFSGSVPSLFLASSTGNSSGSETILGTIANGNGQIVTASASWNAATSSPAGDDLLSTNNGSGGSGPLSLQEMTAVKGLGAYISADGTGSFTAEIQAYANINGALTMVLSKTAVSDASGDPVFLGVSDTVAEITKVVYSLTAVSSSKYSLNDFKVGTLYVEDGFGAPQAPIVTAPLQNSAPEPGLGPLLAFAIPALIWGFNKKASRTV